jgi:dsDNA-specific endonuclease/ATPase MutS2
MGNNLKVGSRVSFLDEQGFGVVQKILNSNQALVMRDDGFEEACSISKLLLVDEETFSESAFQHIPKKTKESDKPKSKNSKKHKKNSGLVWEIDLHIEQLIDNHRNMSNFDIIQVQLQHCKGTIERAIKNNVPRLVIIHGRGEGVLKEEVLHLLKKYPVEAKDADFRTYGIGATEVRFF